MNRNELTAIVKCCKFISIRSKILLNCSLFLQLKLSLPTAVLTIPPVTLRDSFIQLELDRIRVDFVFIRSDKKHSSP